MILRVRNGGRLRLIGGLAASTMLVVLIPAVIPGRILRGQANSQRPSTGAGAKESSPEPALLNPGRAEDEKAIRATVAAFVKAFNAADPAAVASTFAEDAEVVDERGQAATGREAIRAQFARLFEQYPGATLSIHVRSLRFLGPETAIERGTARVTPAEPDSTPDESPYSVVYIKHGDRWLQGSVQDQLAPPEVEPESNAGRLKTLEWMVGEWVTESAEDTVLINTRWAEGNNFLLQEFSVRVQGRSLMTGTQRIGWDPVRKQVRSWVFDSDGGFGESLWSRDGEGRWVIRASGTRREGQTVEATRIITPLDAHRVKVQVTHRTFGGEALPDEDEFFMVKKPPGPGGPAAKTGTEVTKPAPGAR